MPGDAIQTIQALFTNPRPESLREGLALAREELTRTSFEDARPLLGLVTSLFHIDAEDRPEFAAVIDEAGNLIATQGPEVIPLLLEDLQAGDIKAELSLAEVFSRMGPAAIESLVRAYRGASEPWRRTVVVHALGKIAAPQIAMAAPLLAEAAAASEVDLRDNATRALGRMAAHVPAGQLTERVRKSAVERLRSNVTDEDPSVRALAVWGLGQFARFEHLTDGEKSDAHTLCLRLLGRDERFEWDLAYVVRQAAEAALHHLA